MVQTHRGVRPNFLVVGSGKCGTTTLCAALARHPDVFVCEPKEPNFLPFDDVYSRGWDWYEGLFEPGRGACARGEGSVACTAPQFEDRAIERMLKHLPGVKLFYIVRDPFSRVESAFRELHSNGATRGVHVPFSLRAALDTLGDELIGESCYWQRYSKYVAAFSSAQVHVLFLEDFQNDQDGELRKCFEFLGLNPELDLAEGPHRLNGADEKVRDTRLLRLARRVPGLVDFGKQLPGLRSVARKALRKPFGSAVLWDDDARDVVAQAVVADAHRFLSYHGKPTTYWKLT